MVHLYCALYRQQKKKKTKRKHAAIVDEVEEIGISESDSDCPKKKKRGPAPVDTAKRAKGKCIATIDEPEDNEFSDSDSHNSVSLPKMKKKKRGPAKIDVVASIDGKCMDVLFNEIGQAVDDNSIKLSSYIGSLVKQMVPITLNSWHEVDEDLRKRLWICVQQQFIIDDCYRDYILMMMGKIWRTYKSELSRK